MKIQEVIDAAKTKSLTCAMVAELFASQPYTQVLETMPASTASYAIPHAHMHTRDGFHIPPVPPPTSSSAMLAITAHEKNAVKKKFWEQTDSQLFANPTGVTTYDGPAQINTVPKDGVGMDSRMADQKGIYNRRTGLPNMPAQGQTWMVKIAMGGPPQMYEAPDQADPFNVEKWQGTKFYDAVKRTAATKDYRAQNGREVKKGEINDRNVSLEKDKVNYLPPVTGSNPHSMFEDTESAIMTLTAALLSTAGQRALNALLKGNSGGAFGREVSLAVYSRTAVRALNAAVDASKSTNTKSTHPQRNDAVKMVNRVQELTPKRELSGSFKLTQVDIVHTQSTFSNYPDGHLMLVSHFPSANEIADTLAGEDRYEIAQGIFANVLIDDPLPKLVW